ncbi:nucleotidyl transferase AbiEii/AbiGii toxin family protein [Candidatus Uhrbacteria bacterium]|nr:nucleotidyl transferase AbiEii/AbiGii toxin family protein [Candidatus Uhrbacteria bacterium]
MVTSTQFSVILDEAYRSGIPHGHERAILREYIQCELLTMLYELPQSNHLAFIGGTSLRLLHDLDRFSEDLDFDAFASRGDESIPFAHLEVGLRRRGYSTVFKKKRGDSDRGGTFTFTNILFNLGLSRHKDETLKIKIEYTKQPKNKRTDIRTLNRFGFAEQIITLPLDILCARKVHALFGRMRLQPRDLYDLGWFFSRRIVPDEHTLRMVDIHSQNELLSRILALYKTHHSNIANYERDILPFLVDPKNVKLIRLLPSLAQSVLL